MNKVYEKSKIYMKKKWNSNKDDRRKYSEYRNVVSIWSAKKAPEISRRKAKVIKKNANKLVHTINLYFKCSVFSCKWIWDSCR